MSSNSQSQYNGDSILLHSQPGEVQTPLAPVEGHQIIPRQADSDERLSELWLHGRPITTQKVYRADFARLIRFARNEIRLLTLGDLQSFGDSLEELGLAPATRHRILSSCKSLLGFAHRLGYIAFDVGRAMRLPSIPNRLADRILDENQVQRMLLLEAQPRNRMILTLFYAAGVRVSELAGLQWKDCQKRNTGGQITVLGKGGRVRSVLLPETVWRALVGIRRGADDLSPVFRSREGGHLDPSQLMRIVRKAALRAGVAKNVSPHWLRHAHVSHSLDRGCPVHVVSATVGHSSLNSTTRYAHARPTDSSATYLPL
jgi:integrase/recombinase XerD